MNEWHTTKTDNNKIYFEAEEDNIINDFNEKQISKLISINVNKITNMYFAIFKPLIVKMITRLGLKGKVKNDQKIKLWWKCGSRECSTSLQKKWKKVIINNNFIRVYK